MPNWKKVVVSGSDATLNSLYVAGPITGSDVKINGWGSVSASLASINSGVGSLTLQNVTDNGNTTTNDIKITGSLLRFAETGTTSNTYLGWNGLTFTDVDGQLGGGGQFTYDGSNNYQIGTDGLSNLSINTGNTTRILISSSNIPADTKVGVGAFLDPNDIQATLHVSGTFLANNTAIFNNDIKATGSIYLYSGSKGGTFGGSLVVNPGANGNGTGLHISRYDDFGASSNPNNQMLSIYLRNSGSGALGSANSIYFASSLPLNVGGGALTYTGYIMYGQNQTPGLRLDTGTSVAIYLTGSANKSQYVFSADNALTGLGTGSFHWSFGNDTYKFIERKGSNNYFYGTANGAISATSATYATSAGTANSATLADLATSAYTASYVNTAQTASYVATASYTPSLQQVRNVSSIITGSITIYSGSNTATGYGAGLIVNPLSNTNGGAIVLTRREYSGYTNPSDKGLYLVFDNSGSAHPNSGGTTGIVFKTQGTQMGGSTGYLEGSITYGLNNQYMMYLHNGGWAHLGLSSSLSGNETQYVFGAGNGLTGTGSVTFDWAPAVGGLYKFIERTGSRNYFYGTASFATTAATASYVLSASYTPNLQQVTNAGATTTNAITASGAFLNGDVVISGDLDVNGTITYISSSTLQIGDNVIEINYNKAAGNSGILTYDTSAPFTASLLWDATADRWIAGAYNSEKTIILASDTSSMSVANAISASHAVNANNALTASYVASASYTPNLQQVLDSGDSADSSLYLTGLWSNTLRIGPEGGATSPAPSQSVGLGLHGSQIYWSGSTPDGGTASTPATNNKAVDQFHYDNNNISIGGKLYVFAGVSIGTGSFHSVHCDYTLFSSNNITNNVSNVRAGTLIVAVDDANRISYTEYSTPMTSGSQDIDTTNLNIEIVGGALQCWISSASSPYSVCKSRITIM